MKRTLERLAHLRKCNRTLSKTAFSCFVLKPFICFKFTGVTVFLGRDRYERVLSTILSTMCIMEIPNIHKLMPLKTYAIFSGQAPIF